MMTRTGSFQLHHLDLSCQAWDLPYRCLKKYFLQLERGVKEKHLVGSDYIESVEENGKFTPLIFVPPIVTIFSSSIIPGERADPCHHHELRA